MHYHIRCADHVRPVASTVFALFLTVVLPRAAWAQFDNFNSGVDPHWTQYAPLDPYGESTTFTNPFNTYKITTTGSPGVATFGPARAAALRLDASYTDFATQVDLLGWGTAWSQPLGLLARVTTPGLGSTNGYALTYDTTAHTLDLTLITGEQTSSLGSAPVSTNAGDLHLLFTGAGGALTGQIYDASNLTTPLATVTATDSHYASGSNGLVIYDNSTGTNGATGTFDNFGAATTVAGLLVPEPAGLSLLTTAGLLTLCRRRTCR